MAALLGRAAGVPSWDVETVEHHLAHSTTAWLSRLRGMTG
ncbi:MAG: hypothetical protein QOG49_615, partial [Frankiaceae bacterium]|nr:hypothetical protein [Frankiaceae bacterium]